MLKFFESHRKKVSLSVFLAIAIISLELQWILRSPQHIVKMEVRWWTRNVRGNKVIRKTPWELFSIFFIIFRSILLPLTCSAHIFISRFFSLRSSSCFRLHSFPYLSMRYSRLNGSRERRKKIRKFNTSWAEEGSNSLRIKEKTYLICESLLEMKRLLPLPFADSFFSPQLKWESITTHNWTCSETSIHDGLGKIKLHQSTESRCWAEETEKEKKRERLVIV